MNHRTVLGLCATIFAAALLVGGNTLLYSSVISTDDSDLSNTGTSISGHASTHNSNLVLGDVVLPPATAEIVAPVLAEIVFLILLSIFLTRKKFEIARGPPAKRAHVPLFQLILT